MDVLCMACDDKSCHFKPVRMQRRALGPRDVLIDMKFCGVCHTDLHVSANHLKAMGMAAQYPCVPGHELAGVCIAVGTEVTKVKVGDQVGVGCMVDSCQECAACKLGEEQMCKKQVATYNGVDFSGRAAQPGRKTTIGGYTNKHVVDENFAIIIPKSYPLEAAGPIMCAGATMYDPLQRYGATAGTKVAVVGLGGLGVLGIQLAIAMGCEVTAISRGTSKRQMAEALGVTSYLASSDPKAMAAAAGQFELVLNTIPANYDYRVYQRLVSAGGRHVIIGLSTVFIGAFMMQGVFGDRSPVTPSLIAGIPNTQAVVNLCAEKQIKPPCQVRPVSDLSAIYESLDRANDAGMRYVLDLAGTLNDESFSACSPVAAPALKSAGVSPSVLGGLSNFASMFFRTLTSSYPRATLK